MKKIAFWGCLFIFTFKSVISQSWKYVDNSSSIGWKGLEFNQNYIITNNIIDSNSGLYEPGFTVLDTNGQFLKTVVIPLLDFGIVKGIFSGGVVINNNSFMLIGWAFFEQDSQAVLVTALVDSAYDVYKLSFKKIPLNGVVPSRRYSYTIFLNKDSTNNNFYASAVLCSAKYDESGNPLVSSFAMPCFHLFFLLSDSGEILFENRIPVNYNNQEDYGLGQTTVDIQKVTNHSYLIGSIGEGFAILDDSLTIVKRIPNEMGKLFPLGYSNRLIFWNNKYFLLGLVEYWEEIGNWLDRIQILHNKFLIQEITLEGVVNKSILLNLPSNKDTASFWRFKRDSLIESHSVNVKDAVISGVEVSDFNHLLISFKDDRGQLSVINLDSSLSVNWSKIIILNYFNFYNLISTSDGGCLLTGWVGDQSSAYLPLFGIKLNKNGQLSGSNELLFAQRKYNVFPNPFECDIQIENSTAECHEFTLYNNLGAVIINKSSCENANSINISFVPDGIYHYIIRSQSLKVQSGTIIKLK